MINVITKNSIVSIFTQIGSIFPSSSYWGGPGANLYSNIAAASGHAGMPTHASHMTSHLTSYPHYA